MKKSIVAPRSSPLTNPIFYVGLLLLTVQACAFAPTFSFQKSTTQPGASPLFAANKLQSRVALQAATRGDDTKVVNTELLDKLRSMRVKELKSELTALRISTADVFEKDELVQRLYKARQQGENKAARTNGVSTSDIVRAPLFFASMNAGMRVAAVNRGGMTIQPSAQPYAAMQIELNTGYKLTLLLDTACSGLVLRPSVVQTHSLPSYKAPVTMTAAGGTNSNTGLTQVDKFRIGDHSYGPIPAAVQDIGALPSSLDGIMGLSFLNQFACVETDFRDGSLALYKTERRPSVPEGLTVLAEAEMFPTRLGIFTVDVMLDGRGPVRMLVDTGAASSFLNWKGVSALGLSRDSPEVSPITGVPMGAMGADNIAMELTHRYVNKQVNLGNKSGPFPGYEMQDSGVSVDIGNIPVLEALKADGVGGILGIDLLMRFGVVRMGFNGPVPRISLLN